MLKYLPFEKFTLQTSLTVEEVRVRITQNIDLYGRLAKNFSTVTNEKPYRGSINKDHFTMQRIIGYRNSFLPVVKGHIIKEHNRTKLIISMRPHAFVIAFLCIWMGMVSLFCLAIVLHFIIHPQIPTKDSLPLLIPFGMFAFGWALSYFPFKQESKITKADLKNALHAEEVSMA